jgi:hypothetical protein
MPDNSELAERNKSSLWGRSRVVTSLEEVTLLMTRRRSAGTLEVKIWMVWRTIHQTSSFRTHILDVGDKERTKMKSEEHTNIEMKIMFNYFKEICKNLIYK